MGSFAQLPLKGVYCHRNKVPHFYCGLKVLSIITDKTKGCKTKFSMEAEFSFSFKVGVTVQMAKLLQVGNFSPYYLLTMYPFRVYTCGVKNKGNLQGGV